MKKRFAARSALAAGLSLILAALCAGLEPYQAVAAVVEGPAPIGQTAAPVAQLPTLSLPSSAANLEQAPVLPASAVPAADAPASAAEAPQAAPAPIQAPQAAAQALASGAQQLRLARTGERKAGVLDRIFERLGGRISDSLAPAGSSVPSGAPAAQPSSLSKLSSSDLEALAADPTKPDADRRSAVKELARAKGLAALERVGLGEATGPAAADYEIRRAALGELAGLGKVVSLPPVSRELAGQILARLRTNKPAVAAFDYDGTLEQGGQDKVSPETGKLLAGAADAGVETMILTGRSDLTTWRSGRRFLDVLRELPAGQLSKISVGVEQGAKVYLFDRDGGAHLARAESKWTPAERRGVQDAVLPVFRELGEGATPIVQDYKAIVTLRPSLSAAQIEQAARRTREALAQKGIPAQVLPRGQEYGRPYLAVVGVDKSAGILGLRRSRDYFLRLRDSYRFLPRLAQGAYQKLVSKLSEPAVEPAQTLIVGDEFFGEGGVDTFMVKGAPGALALSVGGAADPRLPNVFVWPEKGPAAARQIGEALAYKADASKDAMDGKAVAGWLAQSTVSIVAFVFTSLIYPLIAMPAVGAAHFATLMAIGPFASIATGPLNGRIVDKMTIRNGMALNAFLRGLLVLDMAVFLTLGVLNFWTLALGAIANGWMLSMIMTTENAYLKGIGGAKNASTLFAIGQVRYLSTQVVLNLILGAGALVDMLMHPLSPAAWPWLAHLIAPIWGPRMPFIIASLANFLVVLPISYFMMPNKHVTYRETGEQEQPSAGLIGLLRGLAGGARAALAKAFDLSAWKGRLAPVFKTLAGYKREAALLAITAAIFTAGQVWPAALGMTGFFKPLLDTPLPVTLALLNLIRKSHMAQPVLAHKPLRNVILLISFGAGALVFGMQYVGFPLIAKGVGGAAAGLMLGKLLGAFFFGQLIAYASQADLPKAHLPLLGRPGAQRFVQLGALALTAMWSLHGLFPGSLLAAALIAAGGAALMAGAHRFTQKGLISLLGAGMAAGLGLMALFHPVFLLLGAVALGFSYGAGNNALYKYFYGNVPKGVQMGQAMGVAGSFFNGALSLGYGALSLMTLKWMFPAMFLPLGALYAGAAALFLLAPRLLPGLAGSFFKKKGGK